MLPQISAHATGADEAPPAATIASLLCALLARVLARVPVDERLRAAAVCRDWCALLATDRSIWMALDLTYSSGGVTHAATDAVLRAVAAKAGGALRSLNVSRQDNSFGALLDTVTVNAGLVELRLTDCRFYELNWRRFDVTWFQVQQLLRAAPRLQRLFANVVCCAADAPRVLAHEGVSQPLRVFQLFVSSRGGDNDDAVRAFAASLAAYALPLAKLRLQYMTPLNVPGVLDAVMDGVLANRVVHV
jgi:hypothetical protein